MGRNLLLYDPAFLTTSATLQVQAAHWVWSQTIFYVVACLMFSQNTNIRVDVAKIAAAASRVLSLNRGGVDF